MWKTRHFKSADALARWVKANASRAQIVEIAVCNGWAVEFRPLRRVG